MDDKRYLQTLIREGEHQQQDFKYRVSDAMKLAKRPICAVDAPTRLITVDYGRLRQTTTITVVTISQRKTYVNILSQHLTGRPAL